MFQEEKLFSKEWNVRTSRYAFLRSLVRVFEHFGAAGRQPSSTYWTANHEYMRQYALPSIRREWAEITGLAPELFPWSDDEVATTWEEWRKTNEKYRDSYRLQLGLLEVMPGIAD